MCLHYISYKCFETGNIGWHAREIRRLHPLVDHIIVADLEHVVKIGASLPENKAAGIQYVQGLIVYYIKQYHSDVIFRFSLALFCAHC